MHISALEEYGLRCALHLARAFRPSPASPVFLSASAISEKEGISIEYVSKLMFLFRKSGWIRSTRGIQGGFALTKSPAEISLREVLDSVQGKRSTGHFCNQFSGNREQCAHLSQCSVRPVWTVLYGYFDDMLRELSLDDLLQKESETLRRVESLAQIKTQKIKTEILNRKPSLPTQSMKVEAL